MSAAEEGSLNRVSPPGRARPLLLGPPTPGDGGADACRSAQVPGRLSGLATVLLSVLWLASSSTVAAETSSQPTGGTVPTPADRLAVEGINHAARSVGHLRGDDVIARAGRIRALLQYAESLWPENVQTNRQLMDLYEGLGELSLAASAADRYLQARPQDYAVALRWLRLARSTLSRADDRITLLKKAVQRSRFLPEARAAAWAELCGVYLRQGEDAEAAAACERALALDEFEPAALRARVRAGTKPDPAEAFEADLQLFRANPHSVHLAWELGQVLQAAGGYAASLDFYKHAHALAKAGSLGRNALETLLVDYVNAMLDAGMPEKAVEFFTPLVEQHGHSLALRALIVEAFGMLKKQDEAKAQVAFMAKVYEPLSAPGASRSAEQAAELGWFNLAYQVRPKVALEWAKAAAMSAGEDVFVQRVLGAAELATGDVLAGAKRLAGLAGEDMFAVAILAEHYYAENKPEAARSLLLRAPLDVRTGPAWRRLAGIAERHKVKLPALPYTQAMVRAAKAVEGHYFELGLFPERFVSIALSAPTDSVALGEPMAVTVALKNVSRRPVFLGPDGLFTPVVFLSLAIDGKAKANLENLTAVPLPAPKRLSPGQEVVETVRVDVGSAEQLLMAHPFAELQVTVTAMVDPLQRGEEMVSSVPSIRVAPVTIRRPALFDVSKGATAAQYALGHIAQRDLKAGDLPTQLRAARQTASLLAHVRRAEAGKAEAVYPDVLTKPILLSMTRAFLRDRSPVLRAGMIAALQHVDLDERIIGLLGPNVQDPSAIVRMRLIELLAGKRTRGYETLVDFFAKDRSVAVRGMAAAMGAQP